jgi:tRNA(Ile)-lysidine synthase
MVAPGDTVLVAFSGGPDSTLQHQVLHQLAPSLGIKVLAAHIHHGIRGDEAEADLEAAAAFAKKLGLPFSFRRVNAPARVKAQGESLETAARELRYRALRVIAHEKGANRIATGHTRDDQAETVLMNLLRGSGSRGLGGIPPVREEIIRPLLGVTRAEVEAYCRENKLPYQIDSTNAELTALRNQVRHRALPLLRKLQPDITAALARLAEVLRAEDEVLSELATSTFHSLDQGTGENVCFDLEEFRLLPLALQRRVLREGITLVKGDLLDLSFERIEAALELSREGTVGSVAELATNLVAELEYDRLRIGAPRKPARGQMLPRELPVPGAVAIPEAGVSIAARPSRATKPPAEASVALMDAEQLTGPLIVRSWQPGDRFRPLGMRGSMKLQDLLVNLKVPQAQRSRVLVATSGDRIIWVVGLRLSDEVKVTAKTRRTIRLEVIPIPLNGAS